MRGGDLGWIECSELRSEFSKETKGKKIGSIIGPIETDEGTYFIRINDRKEAKKAEFAKMLAQIKQKIESKRRKIAYDEYIAKLRKKSIIRYFFKR
jgi:parvulin-like peptidyl-prolyl isomerase